MFASTATGTTCSTTNPSWKFSTQQFHGYQVYKNSFELKALQWVEDHIHLRPELFGDYRNVLIQLHISEKAFCDWSAAHGLDRAEAREYMLYYSGVNHSVAMAKGIPTSEAENLKPEITVKPDLIFSLACECGFIWHSPWKSNAEVDEEEAAKLAAQAEAKKALKLASMRYQLRSATDLMSAPPMRWLVRDVLPATGLAALYGPPGSGKSFLLLDLCTAVASGTQWFGHFVKSPAPVVYAVLEGQGAFGNRLRAWRTEHNNTPLPERLRLMTDPLDLKKPGDVKDLCDAVLANGGEGGLIVLDTLSRAAPGMDENSASDMGNLIAACSTIQQKTNSMVLVVHHTGKTEGKGLRGHSSLTGAVDTAIETSRNGDYREWTVAKSRDSADGERHGFVLKLVTMGPDEYGQPVSSYVVAPMDGPAPPAKKLPASLGQVKLVFDHLSKEAAPMKFGKLCEAVKAWYANQGNEKGFNKWNIRRDYAKHFGTDKPGDDTLVSL
ncbi:hypothetical protein GCM10027419_17910 [Pandoraea terrae]